MKVQASNSNSFLEAILLPEGECVLLDEVLRLSSNELTFKFIGAPFKSVVTLTTDAHAFKRNLSKDNITTLDISNVIGNIAITVTSHNNTWHCGTVCIIHDTDGTSVAVPRNNTH